ncbi:solute carrier family 10 (sodium/bile acid cotransporter), member 7 [Izhakiella capsodis]|uniref:Solute carrier family 10 (Sodium/bile acid cotransporter), member 7 n=1 Tax=Izhakiella capsodis TaxID=1367852 RepID=A0A1I4WJ21_9GAMM|nr:bile acid:sodium symporter family protein [Izhakiella capsodis]SFN13222.1 solute carrier family 10 (sodium/bile acid cotransporter), member 7 [Izhakiella capsodis]
MGVLRLDPMMVKLIITVLLASFFPAKGGFVPLFEGLTTAAIALLFFLHGAKLSRENIIAGSSHWRLHVWIMFSTFILFPTLGLLVIWWHPVNVGREIYTGFLYLCILPATVQSSIAFTSIAGGNVAAAVCSASASSLLGVFISPLLVGLLMNIHHHGGAVDGLEQIGKIMLQLLLPFVLGQFSRRWIGNWIERHRSLIGHTDQTSILLVVYTAFSAAVVSGIWHQVDIMTLLWILIGSLLLLLIVLSINLTAARLFGFKRADEITVLFCGSKKSLANGIPMANILFPAATVGIIVLPLMIFHQIQLMTCSFIAQRYQKQGKKAEDEPNKLSADTRKMESQKSS